MHHDGPVIVGILVYILFYLYATTLYPGGSQADALTAGFDWKNNYWCNLLNERAVNGLPNPARSVAILANSVLCLTMIWFFVRFAVLVAKDRWTKGMLISMGTLSMTFAIFLGSDYHDVASLLSGTTGIIALSIIYFLLYRLKSYYTLFLGLFCAGVIAINNIIYFTGIRITVLPFLQKGTLLIIFCWVILVNQQLNRLGNKN